MHVTGQTGQVIYLIDDDPRVLDSLSELFASSATKLVSFRTASAYLANVRTDSAACLILDIVMPDMNGLDLQQQLSGDNDPPIIFITGHADIPLCVRAMRAGAIEFLLKPVNKQALLTAIEAAFELDRKHQRQKRELEGIKKGLSLLTPREREVLPLIAEGLLNKQAAAALGISEVTLQVHRGQIMRKMAASSFADLVRMASKLGITNPTHSQNSRKYRGVQVGLEQALTL
jgi:FixJ family two-component response regulator